MQDLLPWMLFALATVVVVLLLRDKQHRAQQFRHETAAVTAEHVLARDDLARKHARDIAEATRRRDQAAEAVVRAHATERAAWEESVRDARADAAEARTKLAATWGNEASSHEEILRAFSTAGLEGVLATNVVFSMARSDGARYVQQIDHVVVTPQKVIVIENKRRRGVVFGGVRPSSVHESYRQLVDEEELVGTFAVQLARLSSSSSSPERIVRTHAGKESPATQVRRQAAGLRGHVLSRLEHTIWSETAVFYSYPGASLHVRSEDRTANGVTTRILAGSPAVTALAEDIGRWPKREVGDELVRRLAALFREDGAHVDELRRSPDL